MNESMWVSKNADDIAKYVVCYANAKGSPITHLKLQKILYYLQGTIAAKFEDRKLFADSIEAWQYGPVVRAVYYEYCSNGSLSLKASDQNELGFSADMLKAMNEVIDEKLKLTESQLVRATHQELPWRNHAAEVAAGKKPEIPFSEIAEFFKLQVV